MTRILYMGTPGFAVPPLRVLLEENYRIVGVVTQPDRPTGRGRRPQPTPVKELALQHELPLWQPASLRTPAARERLQELSPDLIIVAAFGEILGPEILQLPRHGCLNIHASLLPRHRGPAPVAAAILAGDLETGITLMQMDEGMDTGPIIAATSLPLNGTDRRGELTARLAEIGAGLLRHVLPAWLAGEITPQPQDDAAATTCRMLRKGDGEIDWSQPAVMIERMVRAYDPWPGTYTFLEGRRLRIWEAAAQPESTDLLPGTLLVRHDQLLAATGEGTLRIAAIQLEGKCRLPTAEFLPGQHGLTGLRLGR